MTDTTDGGAEVATLALTDDDDSLQTALLLLLLVVVSDDLDPTTSVVVAALTTGIISTDEDDVLTEGNPTDSQLFDTGRVAIAFSSFGASGFDLTDEPPTTASSSDSKAQFALRFRSL